MSTINKKTAKVFEDLEAFRDFCVEYGFVFKTEDMYRKSSHVWRMYSQRFLVGKPVKSMWEVDADRFKKSR